MKLPKDGPRAVRPSPLMRKSKIAIPAIYALVSAVLFAISRIDVSNLARLEREGLSTSAHVYGKEIKRGESDKYVLEWSFVVAQSLESGSMEVSHEQYERTNIGDSLAVTYVPQNPAIHRFGPFLPESKERNENWFLGMTALTLVACLAYGGQLAAYSNQRRLLTTGQIQYAPVRFVKVEQTTEDPQRIISYAYEYKPGDIRNRVLAVSLSTPYGQKVGDLLPYISREDDRLFGTLVMDLNLVELEPLQPSKT